MGKKKKVAIIGTNGIPARYGGFETLAENLVDQLGDKYEFIIYCSNIYKKNERKKIYKNAKLKYIPLKANGWQSILYDLINIFHAWFTADVLLVLGPATGFIFPLNKIFNKKLIINHGGLNEWEREKLSPLEKKYAYYSHKIAAESANENVADNLHLKESLKKNFNIEAEVIEYGGDHVTKRNKTNSLIRKYPFLNNQYDLSISRAQPDNNLHLLLNVYAKLPRRNLVLISNWEISEYGKELKTRFKNRYPNINIVDSIYDKIILDVIRSNAELYIHSHSQCGTSPSLVEAMNYEIPIICFDVCTNRSTTKNRSCYFHDEESLIQLLSTLTKDDTEKLKHLMKEIADENYTWKIIANKYDKLIEKKFKEKMERIKTIINTILRNRGKKEIDSIDENTNLRDDIGFDSLDLAELTVRIEAEYDVDIFENGIVNTVGEILQKIERK
jgi:acyl carrier protein